MERQYLIFIIAAAAAFGALIIVGLYFNPLRTDGDTGNNDPDRNVIKARVGDRVYVRYSSNVVSMIQRLPEKSNLELEASSELHNINLGGLRGELHFSDMTIAFFQDGEEEKMTDDEFKTIEYRFAPDAGNQTVYTYEDVEFKALTTDSELIATFVPLSTAEVGQRYKVKLILDAGIINYAIEDRIIEIVN